MSRIHHYHLLFCPSTDLLLNSSLQTILMNEPGQIQLRATWQLACQESDDCDTLVDFVMLRCRGDDDDVIEGRSQCDGVMSDGDVSVIGRELSHYECNITAFSTNGVMLATNTIDVSTPQSGMTYSLTHSLTDSFAHLLRSLTHPLSPSLPPSLSLPLSLSLSLPPSLSLTLSPSLPPSLSSSRRFKSCQ